MIYTKLSEPGTKSHKMASTSILLAQGCASVRFKEKAAAVFFQVLYIMRELSAKIRCCLFFASCPYIVSGTTSVLENTHHDVISISRARYYTRVNTKNGNVRTRKLLEQTIG